MLLGRTLRTLPGQIAGPLAQMAAAVAFTHSLSVEALGIYALAWAAQELVYYGIVAWWTAYVQRHAAAHGAPEALARLNAAETAVQIGSAIVQAILAAAAIAAFTDAPLGADFLAAVAAFTVSRNLATHFAARARAEDSDLAFTILQAGGPLGGLALGLVALAVVSPTAEALLLAYALAQGLSLAGGLVFMRFRPARPRFDRVMLSASWLYGAPLIAANLLEWLANHGVRLIVEMGAGAAGVGLVTTAWWLGLRIGAFVSLLVTGATFAAAIRELDHHGAEGARAQLADNGALLLFLLAPAIAGGALVAAPFAALAVAEPFRAATAALLPLALAAGGLKAFREHGPEQALLVFGRTRAAALTALIEAASTVALCALGLALWGLPGALGGAALASLIGAASAQALAARLTGYFLRRGDLARIAAATALMTGAVALLPQGDGWRGLALPVLAGVLVYGLSAAALWWPRLRAWRTARRR